VFRLPFNLIALVYFVISVRFDIIAFVYFVISAFGYQSLILSNFTTSSMSSHLLCDGLSETPKT